jgi:hypothetical protein
METERIALSQRERDRLKVLHEVKQKHVTQAGLRGARVEIERRLDGSHWLRFRDRYLRLRYYPQQANPSDLRPSGLADQKPKLPVRAKTKYRPLSDHPWRKSWKRTLLNGKKADISTLR